jgi:hypothetical protein
MSYQNWGSKLTGDMKMKSKLKIVMQFLIGVSFFAISACGGSGGGSDDPETSTDCVLGTSTIGECKI